MAVSQRPFYPYQGGAEVYRAYRAGGRPAPQTTLDMKRQPNMKSYWMKEGSVFHCPIISKLMTHDRFMELTTCFHITNPTMYVREKGLLGYDKLGQTRWLVDRIRKNCKRVWKLGKMCTINEIMIRYKGTYCPLHQYVPQKPQKWGIKVWCTTCLVTKFV
jgi:hypothetical protein